MPKNIGSLQQEALESCAWRGHTMSKWSLDHYWPHRYTSTCAHCGASVTVSSYPPHSNPEIMGDAVAINCPQEEA